MLENLLDQLGEPTVLALAGLIVGLIFGAGAQHSRFCLRAACVELAEGSLGARLAIWGAVFCAAVALVQGGLAAGWLDLSEARQLASAGSLSGAAIGGLMFGAGMILARGCASRLLVLAATGNLRAIITGLVLTLVAQASLRGVLAPAREALSGLWVVPGGPERSLLMQFDVSHAAAALVAVIGAAAALSFGRRHGVSLTQLAAALAVGSAVALGWALTYAVSQTSFELVPLSSVTFTGPSADTLMGLVNAPDLPLGFGVGLVPGVILGSATMALLTQEARIERFGPDTPMERYLVGAVLMGFGSMLAGGCAVGAGVSGGSIFAITAWLAVFCMWIGAVATHRVLLWWPGSHRSVPA